MTRNRIGRMSRSVTSLIAVLALLVIAAGARAQATQSPRLGFLAKASRPELTMVLGIVPVRGGGDMVGWTVMEGAGMQSGDKTADIDAMTGEVKGTQTM